MAHHLANKGGSETDSKTKSEPPGIELRACLSSASGTKRKKRLKLENGSKSQKVLNQILYQEPR